MKRIAAIILAAGSSGRMGSPKQLLPYNNSTLLKNVLIPVSKLFPQSTYLVLGANADLIQANIAPGDYRIILNTHWTNGMAGSVITGLQAAANDFPDLDAVIFLAADQPYVTASHIASMVDSYLSTDKPIIASTYNGSIGVPALFDRKLFPELEKLKGDAGARQIINQAGEAVWSIPLANGHIDIDTPEQYKQLINKSGE